MICSTFNLFVSEINSTMSPASIEDINLKGIEDVIYQKDAVMDALEFTFSNSTESNEIPAFILNSTTVTPSRTNYTTQGELYNSMILMKCQLLFLHCNISVRY